MSLKSKLQRLPGPKLGAAASDGHVPKPEELRHKTIEELRLMMDEVLDRTEKRSVEAVEHRFSILPFSVAPIGSGRLHVRCQRVAASKSIGRIPVDAARTASAEVLSLLALDPELNRFDPARALYLDTETTGLGGGAGTIAFLIGLARFVGDELWLEQLLLTSPVDEPALLELLDERLRDASMLVTFNGKSFDWPMLMGRYVMNRRTQPMSLPHLDLLHVARRLHKLRLGSVTLKRLESEVLGLVRGEDIEGAEIGSRYAHYLRTADENALKVIIEHNATDVLSMAALVGLYGEPLPMLAPQDLVGLGRTLSRAGRKDAALDVAEQARATGGGSEALRLLAQLHKARGERMQALLRFEELAAEVDEPRVRLELAKLYEHLVKDHRAALELITKGTGESEVASNRRRARLVRKLASGKRNPGGTPEDA